MQSCVAHICLENKCAGEMRMGFPEACVEFWDEGVQQARDVEDAGHRIAGGAVVLDEPGFLAHGGGSECALEREGQNDLLHFALRCLCLRPLSAGGKDRIRRYRAVCYYLS